MEKTLKVIDGRIEALHIEAGRTCNGSLIEKLWVDRLKPMLEMKAYLEKVINAKKKIAEKNTRDSEENK